MKVDDALDADLTDLGRAQAKEAGAAIDPALVDSVELLVASTLSRAIETAQLVFPTLAKSKRFVALEALREWNGVLLNAKRRPSHDLRLKFPDCDFDNVPAEEESWDVDVNEGEPAVAARGFIALEWLWARPEAHIAVVAHGGIYHALFSNATLIEDSEDFLKQRFSNCEVRTITLTRQGDAFVAVPQRTPQQCLSRPSLANAQPLPN
mmetsp:Transcript_8418/g.29590  ORF Transcript_8418/g.29590 Transcript_8418/m.29590 type:complete len:208 (+) Transcript_8418:344-967(+)